MSEGIRALKTRIRRSVDAVIATEAFQNWLKNEKVRDDDLVILNNSFIYRKPVIKTSKNEQYLCLKVKGGKASTTNLFVVKPGEINSDFKLFSRKSQNLPHLTPLDQALQQEVQRIGPLVFVLIGELRDTECSVLIRHRSLKELKYDPTAPCTDIQDTDGGGKLIVVNQLTDPEAAWNAIKEALAEQAGNGLSNLESAFAEAFEKLREEARKQLILPGPGTKRPRNSVTLLSQFRTSVSQQRRLYSEALSKYREGGTEADAHLRDAMRIAYNFADDAIKILELLVSVADLKAVLLWSTIKEHFDNC